MFFYKKIHKKLVEAKIYTKLPHWNRAETGGNFVQIFASTKIFMYFLIKNGLFNDCLLLRLKMQNLINTILLFKNHATYSFRFVLFLNSWELQIIFITGTGKIKQFKKYMWRIIWLGKGNSKVFSKTQSENQSLTWMYLLQLPCCMHFSTVSF